VGIPVGRADGSSDGYHVGRRDGPAVADCGMPRVGIADGWTLAPSCPSGGQLVPPLEGAAMIALERVRLLLASQASHSSQLPQEETTQSTGQAPRLHAESSRASSQAVPSRVERLRYRTPVSQVVEQAYHCCSTSLYKSRMSRERETRRAPAMRRSDSCLHRMRPAVRSTERELVPGPVVQQKSAFASRPRLLVRRSARAILRLQCWVTATGPATEMETARVWVRCCG